MVGVCRPKESSLLAKGSKILQVPLRQELAALVDLGVQGSGESKASLVRRALVEYFERNGLSLQGSRTVTQPLPNGEVTVTEPAGAPSFSPPSFPPAPPISPPSISPPKQEGRPSASEEPPPADALLEFRCIPGRRSRGTRWYLTAEQVRRWEETYPDLDVLGEARRARDYLEAKGPRTSDGMPVFLLNWFNRGVNSGRYLRRSTPAARPKERRTLPETYGYSSWEAWEAKLREHLSGRDLEVELERLRDMRTKWEAEDA